MEVRPLLENVVRHVGYLNALHDDRRPDRVPKQTEVPDGVGPLQP